MVVCQPTATPISARRRLSHWLLVSRFWPLVSSLPIERISVFMGAGGRGPGERLLYDPPLRHQTLEMRGQIPTVLPYAPQATNSVVSSMPYRT